VPQFRNLELIPTGSAIFGTWTPFSAFKTYFGSYESICFASVESFFLLTTSRKGIYEPQKNMARPCGALLRLPFLRIIWLHPCLIMMSRCFVSCYHYCFFLFTTVAAHSGFIIPF
jgi:hypothetical protein